MKNNFEWRNGGMSQYEERDLAIKAKEGDIDARNQVIVALFPRIEYIARRFLGRTDISQQDLVQEGVLGLMEAFKKYNPSRNDCFYAFALFDIRGAMLNYIAEAAKTVRTPDNQTKAVTRLQKDECRDLQQMPNNEMKELLGKGNIKIELLRSAIRARKPMQSLDGCGEDQLHSKEKTPYEIVVCAEFHAAVREILTNEHERLVIWQTFGLDGHGKRKSWEIEAEIERGERTVRRLKKNAIARLLENLPEEFHSLLA